MPRLRRPIYLTVLLLSAVAAPRAFARPQTPNTSEFKAVHVLGVDGVKRNAKGKVNVSNGTLEFTSGSAKGDVAIASIQDVLTGADSQRLVGGAIGTLSMFAPYESGRFLSLFRTKIDTLTILYRDSGGGLHGAIFTLGQGQAAPLKKEMVAEGAKTSVPVEEANQQADNGKAKEKKQ